MIQLGGPTGVFGGQCRFSTPGAFLQTSLAHTSVFIANSLETETQDMETAKHPSENFAWTLADAVLHSPSTACGRLFRAD